MDCQQQSPLSHSEICSLPMDDSFGSEFEDSGSDFEVSDARVQVDMRRFVSLILCSRVLDCYVTIMLQLSPAPKAKSAASKGKAVVMKKKPLSVSKTANVAADPAPPAAKAGAGKTIEDMYQKKTQLVQ